MVSRWADYDPGGAGAPGTETAGPARSWWVRPATTEDVDAVAAISIAREGDGEGAVEADRTRRALDRSDALLLVAEATERQDVTELPVAWRGLVGYARAGLVDPTARAGYRNVPGGWYLLGVVVVDAWRRRGVGSELTRRRLEWLAERTDTVHYVTNARNLPSLDLHARLGFRVLTEDFDWPGMSFEGGSGVICVRDPGPRPAAAGVP